MRAGSALLVALVACAAGAETRWGLTFKSESGCIGAADLAEAIEKRLGRATFGAKPDVRIEGWVRGDGPKRWRARLTLVDADGTVKGSREVSADGASCRAIDESLTLVAAVMIDAGAGLSASPAPAEPGAEWPRPEVQPKPVEPPPPPSSEAPRVLLPKLPPREEWPGYLVVDAGSFSQDGRWMSRSTFYRVVGRPDLDASHSRRVTVKSLGYVLGTAGLTTGLVLGLLQAANVSCVRYDGNPLSKGACLESRPWPLVSGIVSAGLGVVAIVLAAVLNASPTSAKEDADLAETYNAKLKPPMVPVTASR